MVSNHSVLRSGHISFIPCYGSVLLSLPLGGKIASIVCTLLLWALLPSLGIHASRYSIKCTNVEFFCIDFSKSVLQHCLRIHLDCLETSKSNLFGPQDCLKRCRGGPWGKLIHPLGNPLASTICLSGESVVSIVNSCGRSGPKKEGRWHIFWMCLNPILMV